MQAKKKCIVHIGTSKTGSTSLQQTLAKNRDLLRKYGYYYPEIGMAHSFLMVCVVEDPTSWPRVLKKRMDTEESAARFREEMIAYLGEAAATAGSDTTIFSSEYLAGLHRDQVVTLKALLGRHFDEVTVVCYLRHPQSHTISNAQQGIKAGYSSLDAIRERKAIFRPSRLENSYVSIFGMEALRVREFSREALVNGDVIDDFCATIAMPSDLVSGLERAHWNESLSMEGALIANAIAKELPRTKDGKWNPERSHALKQILESISGHKFTLPPASLEALAADFEKEANYVRQRFGLAMKPPVSGEANSTELWGNETLRDIGKVLNDLCIQLDQHKVENATRRVRSLIEQKQLDEAMALLQQTFKHRHHSATYFLLLSQIEQCRGDRHKARAVLIDAAKRFPRQKNVVEQLRRLNN